MAVAANFKGTIERIGKEFTAKTGHTASSSVRRPPACSIPRSPTVHPSISSSADVATPQKLESEGKGSERFTYAIGQLGLWQKGASSRRGHLAPLAGELAIANPKTAPYGAAAMATLAHLKIDPKQYRVLTGTNISQTWQFVDTGNAKLGFVAWANLVEAGKTGEA